MALNLYAVLEGVIYVKDCLISREPGTSNILAVCCQIVRQKTPFSFPETGESLAKDFLYSDVCRVETGENCTSPAPKEGRSAWPPSPGDLGEAGMSEQIKAETLLRSEASGKGEKLEARGR